MINRILPLLLTSGLGALVFIIAPNASFAADAPKDVLNVAGDYAFETSPLMQEFLSEDRRTPPVNWASRSGAAGINTRWETNDTLPWFIESQKEGWDWIASGVAMTNQDAVRWGLKILDWGWARMEADGSFKHPDNYHSASFFIEATAHSILLLENSPWRTEFAPQLDALKPKLLLAARWMIRPDIDALNWPDDAHYPKIFGDRRYAHRRFLDAAALGEVAVIFDDKALMEKAVWLIRNGIAFQQADGVNPERGGHDTSYQALGLLYACRDYQMVANEALRAEMSPMLDKGFNWLKSRVRPDGRIDGTGNTRTGPAGELGRNGRPKPLDYHTTAVVFAHWAQITGNADWEKLARSVAELERQAQVTKDLPAK